MDDGKLRGVRAGHALREAVRAGKARQADDPAQNGAVGVDGRSLAGARGLSRRARLSLMAAGALALILLWRPLSRLLLQAALAWALASAATPLSKRLDGRMPRALSALVALLSTLGLLFLAVALILPRAVSQFVLILQSAPSLLARAQALIESSRTGEFLRELGVRGALFPSLGEWLAGRMPALGAALGRIADVASSAVLAPVLGYYFLRDREAFCFRLSLYIPLKKRRRVLSALHDMRREIAGYLRGQLLISLCIAVLTALSLLILGVPAWLALGLLMGVLEFIPYVGPLLGALPVALFALPMGFDTLALSMLALVAVQQIEGMWLAPRLMADATGLHPAHVLLLMSGGGLAFGLAGMLLALPVFVCVRSAVRELRKMEPPELY